METNVRQFKHSTIVPAGIFAGTELFAYEGELYAIREGNRMLFVDLPSSEKRTFFQMYLADKKGQQFIKKQFGIDGVESGFKKWLFCQFAALDGNADHVNGRILPDKYNNACSVLNCPGRGKFCGVISGLKGYEIETIQALKDGQTAQQIADDLSVSVPAVKSRIERLKERFEVANVVALVATVTELGV